MTNLEKCILAALATLTIPTTANADFHFAELKSITIEYKSFFGQGYRPTINQNGMKNRELGQELMLTTNIDLASYFFFNSRIHGATDQPVDDTGKRSGNGQFRDVGLAMEFGVRLGGNLEFLYSHHSQHMLDFPGNQHFPTEDSFGVRMRIYFDPRPGQSVF